MTTSLSDLGEMLIAVDAGENLDITYEHSCVVESAIEAIRGKG